MQTLHVVLLKTRFLKLFEDHIPYLVFYSFLGRSLSKISYFEVPSF